MSILDYKKYHFVGIGGIGISAIARMLFLSGKEVAGSDSNQSEITSDLQKLGLKIFIGQKKENLDNDVEVVIFTVAVGEDNPELKEARKRGLPRLSYPEALGEISKNMFTIAISGTHGKTTTTAMIGHILKKAGIDPTIIVGSKMLGNDEDQNSNFHAGKSKYLVVEACEYKRSFLNIHPTILVITNIEADHLDYYKDLSDIQDAFNEMVSKVPSDGFVITNPEEKNIRPVLKKTKARVLDYGLVQVNNKIGVSGKHNILDAQAAIKVAGALGINEQAASEYLFDFKGTWRRLEYKGEKGGNIFYDDYAHHPTEIKASLSALREKHPDKELVCVFEAHQQSRTRTFFQDFVESLSIADRVFIAPIFITRETDDGVTTNLSLTESLKKYTKASATNSVNGLKKEIQNINSPKPLCIVLMGAGDIYKWTSELLK